MGSGEDDDGECSSGNLLKCCSSTLIKVVVCVSCGAGYHRSCFCKRGGEIVNGDCRITCIQCQNKCKGKSNISPSTPLTGRNENPIEIYLWKKLYEEVKSKNEILIENKILMEEKINALNDEIKYWKGQSKSQETATPSDNSVTKKGPAIVINETKNTPNVNTVRPTYKDVLILKTDNKMSSDEIKKDLICTLNPKLISGIKAKSTNAMGTLILESDDKQRINEIKESIQKIFNTKYTVKENEPQLPRIKIIKIHGELYENQDILNMITKQNDLDENQSTFIFKQLYKTKLVNSNFDLCFEVDPLTFSIIISKGFLYVGFKKCKIFEEFNITRCYKCNRFGHKSNNCKNELTCSKCSEKHDRKECKNENISCVNCNIYNSKFKSSRNTNHEANSLHCPTYQAMVNNIKCKINYNSL